ncbi:GNAT family N-acetyltransferase [Proteiniclasticum sp. C24MP]|uniref:GNAT family N-acetyltransferase n=1 Tax=Proteiniclasticum sp. C24MP TaxID=3374101 RepID=UPI003754C61E
MIRDYKKSDLDEIIRIYTGEYRAMPEEIEALKAAAKILVYEEGDGIRGFVHIIGEGNHRTIEMGILKRSDIIPLGHALWHETEKYLKEHSVSFIQTYHVKYIIEYEQLFHQLSFEYWYSVYRLRYQGNKFPETSIHTVQYEDRYYEDKIRLESEAFFPLRKKHDIRPYNWYLSADEASLSSNRKYTEKNKNHIHLFFNDDELAGASMVKEAEIELLFTNVKFQGRGLGRQILKFSVNRGLEQNPSGVSLNVLAENEKALKLYTDTGFEFIQAQDSRKLLLR